MLHNDCLFARIPVRRGRCVLGDTLFGAFGEKCAVCSIYVFVCVCMWRACETYQTPTVKLIASIRRRRRVLRSLFP